MEITQSSIADIIYVDNNENPDLLPKKDLFTIFNDKAFTIIDGNIGVHEQKAYSSIKKIADTFLSHLPFVAAAAFTATWLVPVSCIPASLITLASSATAFVFKETILKEIDTKLPTFQPAEVKAKRLELLNNYTAGILGDLQQSHNNQTLMLTAYLKPKELLSVFDKELKSMPLDFISKRFNLNDLPWRQKFNLQDAFMIHFVETYNSSLLNDFVDNESQEVGAILNYIDAYANDTQLPHPNKLLNSALLPPYLGSYTSEVRHQRKDNPALFENLFSKRLYLNQN